MKKVLLILFAVASICSCNRKTPEQSAQEALDKYNKERLNERQKLQRQTDSLLRIINEK